MNRNYIEGSFVRDQTPKTKHRLGHPRLLSHLVFLKPDCLLVEAAGFEQLGDFLFRRV
jgi:hypothetical protein